VTRAEFLSTYAQAFRSRSGGHRPILVGQAAPARANSHALLPFPAGCAGERLFRMSGWSLLDFLRDLDRINTLSHFPGRSGKGDAFPLSEARPAAARLEQELSLGTRLVNLCGQGKRPVLRVEPASAVHAGPPALGRGVGLAPTHVRGGAVLE
jgi:hypothetical protein